MVFVSKMLGMIPVIWTEDEEESGAGGGGLSWSPSSFAGRTRVVDKHGVMVSSTELLSTWMERIKSAG